MRSRSLRRLILGSFSALALLITANGIAAVAVARQRTSVGEELEATLERARVDVSALGRAFVDQETGARGYVITGDDAFLDPYRSGVAAERAVLDRLRIELAEDATLSSAVDQLAAGIAEWRTVAAEIEIDLRTAGDVEGAARIVQSGIGRERFDELRRGLDSLTSDIDASIARRRSQLDRRDAWIAATLAVSSVAAIVGVALLAAELRRLLTRPLDEIAGHARLVAAGDLGEPVPIIGATELQQLAADIEAMRERLVTDAERLFHGRLVLAEEAERRRIATGIHDDSLQALTAVALRLQHLRITGGPELADRLHTIDALLADAMQRLRHLLFELHPPTLDREGLAAAIELLLEDSFEHSSTTFDVCGSLDGEPDSAAAVLLYRAAREAVSNAARHAHATHVTVSLDRSNGVVSVSVTDDGVGFDPTAIGTGEAGHLGFRNVIELVSAVGGTGMIDSAPGRGTTFSASVPDTSPRARAGGRRGDPSP